MIESSQYIAKRGTKLYHIWERNRVISSWDVQEFYQNFATSIRAYQTLKTYRYRLVQYVPRVRDTIDLDKIIATDLNNRKQAEVYIKRFIDELKTRGVSEYYIKSSFVAIRHFYGMNDCVLNWRRLRAHPKNCRYAYSWGSSFYGCTLIGQPINIFQRSERFLMIYGFSIISEKSKHRESYIAIVSIRDSGSSIDPQIMPIMFTKFVTRSEKGTGLGLYICKRIIEAHGGEI